VKQEEDAFTLSHDWKYLLIFPFPVPSHGSSLLCHWWHVIIGGSSPFIFT
jgi:hypothetical protein